MLSDPQNQLVKWGDSWSSYSAARALIIISQVYNFILIFGPLVILFLDMFTVSTLCVLAVPGVAEFIFLAAAALVTTHLFENNGFYEHNSDWGTHCLWLNMMLSVACIALPLIMAAVAKRIDELKQVPFAKQSESVATIAVPQSTLDVQVEHYE